MTESERLKKREEHIRNWLIYVHDLYADLVSRPSEQASVSGFDAEPSVKPCEHRLPWRRGKLCLACDNTGWRKLTHREKVDNEGIDPYAAEVSRGITIVKDESAASVKQRHDKRIDAILLSLESAEKVQSGEEAKETTESRNFRIVAEKHASLRKILASIEQLKSDHPMLYWRMSGEQLVRLLARIVPGRIRPTPGG